MSKTCTQCENALWGNQQKYCSNACKQRAHWHQIKSQTNTYHSQTKRAVARKIRYIAFLGGKCSACGYDKNLAALEFNHLDPGTKTFGIDMRKMSNTSEALLLAEVKKCVLLCANCHREHHYPELELEIARKNFGPIAQR